MREKKWKDTTKEKRWKRNLEWVSNVKYQDQSRQLENSDVPF